MNVRLNNLTSEPYLGGLEQLLSLTIWVLSREIDEKKTLLSHDTRELTLQVVLRTPFAYDGMHMPIHTYMHAHTTLQINVKKEVFKYICF